MSYRLSVSEVHSVGGVRQYINGFASEAEADEWAIRHLSTTVSWRIEQMFIGPPAPPKPATTESINPEDLAALGLWWAYPFG